MQVAIIGMGLIGVSLGMALREADERSAPLGKTTVVGYDRDPRATSDARGRLAIDREARTLKDAVEGADLVVLAVPVQAIRAVMAEIAPLLANNAVVTDVASTKQDVMAWALELLPQTVDFIGGHPMAGKEQSGPQAADHKLFHDAIYCLTSTPRARQDALDTVEALVRQVKAKPYHIDPAEHDAYVAGVSHLPFVLSAALVEATSRSPAWKEMAPLAATGYRDISRLASGSVEMHRDICLTNREGIARWIDETVEVLLELRGQLEAGDSAAVQALFERARATREQWLESRPNMRPGEEFFENVNNVERPGLFGRIRPPKR
ncbi:MAG TPA: prephenate dehydrogenase/arogenate dehydrogenase family protein [Roseiflexaceae bacterium]|nr:prephenate dehydrogenase/arogenate dehydrogenase family protein [Roseiflexaceae bacterium]